MKTYIMILFVVLFLYLVQKHHEYFIPTSEIDGIGNNLPTDALFDKQILTSCECIKPGYIYILNDDYKLTKHIACLDTLR